MDLINPKDWGLPHDEWRPNQFETIQWLTDNIGKTILLQAVTGCHRKGQGILMYNGSIKPIEDIVVGDKVMGINSLPRTVLELHRGFGEMAEIVPVKGEKFVVNLDHVLTLIQTGVVRTSPYPSKPVNLGGEIIDTTVREYLHWDKRQKHIYKLFRSPAKFNNNQNPSIDPYFLGILIADGSFKSSVSITTMEQEVLDVILKQANRYGLKIRTAPAGKATTYTLTNQKCKNCNLLINQIRDLGLLYCSAGEKFIPESYKTADDTTRREILAGILDGDGYYNKSCYDIITKSPVLANDIAFIARSLGLAAYIKPVIKGIKSIGFSAQYFRLSISGHLEQIPFRVARRIPSTRQQKKDVLRTGFHINVLPDKENYYGFVLDGDGRYLLDNFTITHNSGKTSLIAALAKKDSVTALCRTKNLQVENYQNSYGFDIMFGKGNYDCVHPLRIDLNTHADTCPFAEGGMHKCPVAENCSYLNAKRIAMRSKQRSLNYAYYLSARWPRIESLASNILALDEAHELSDIVLEWAGLSINQKAKQKWNLPEFPAISGSSSSILMNNNPVELAQEWLLKASKHLTSIYNKLSNNHQISFFMSDISDGNDSESENNSRKLKQCESLLRKVDATISALANNPNDWYIKSSPSQKDNFNPPSFTCKPLSARYHFKNYFSAKTLILMSATIGNEAVFAQELGIDNYEYSSIPNQWPSNTRPVIDLKCPSMGYKATPADYETQARIIAKNIKDCPANWNGVIHVTRKTESHLLGDRLKDHGLRGRIWYPAHDTGTDEQMRQWSEVKRNNPGKGMIAVVWTWGTGVDLKEERICISAKIPYPSLGDPFEQARLRYSGKTYLWRTAVMLTQSLGRTRRGEKEDYDLNGKREQLVAIADGSWTRVKSYMPADLLDAITS